MSWRRRTNHVTLHSMAGYDDSRARIAVALAVVGAIERHNAVVGEDAHAVRTARIDAG
jgi:hypothetical protein